MEAENETKTPEEQFRQNIRNLLIEWYSQCPNSMKFTSNVIKAYKKTFPDDEFMKEVDHGI